MTPASSWRPATTATIAPPLPVFWCRTTVKTGDAISSRKLDFIVDNLNNFINANCNTKLIMTSLKYQVWLFIPTKHCLSFIVINYSQVSVKFLLIFFITFVKIASSDRVTLFHYISLHIFSFVFKCMYQLRPGLQLTRRSKPCRPCWWPERFWDRSLGPTSAKTRWTWKQTTFVRKSLLVQGLCYNQQKLIEKRNVSLFKFKKTSICISLTISIFIQRSIIM